jgi:septal ring factor EnvC (AmiA/AmiB activator)
MGFVVLLFLAAVLGWLLFMAEHSKRKSSERRSAELEGNISAHEQSLADAERRLGQTKSKQDSLWENYFLLEEQNKKLQEQNLKWEKQNRDLEKNVAKLEGMLQERQTAAAPKRATAIEAALPTDVRLASGTAVQELSSYGGGKLEVDNWLSADAIIKLVRTYDG